MDEHGGGIAFPSASAFLQFPTHAVSRSTTVTCARVRHEDSPLEPNKGEVFCSSMIKIEYGETTFNEPVTILLSHSASDEDPYDDYYEITMKQLRLEWDDLETQRINKFEGIC